MWNTLSDLLFAVLSRSVVSHSLRLHRTVALQAPLSMWILQARIVEWVPCPPPGDLPNPGIEPRSPELQADSLPFELPVKHIRVTELNWIELNTVVKIANAKPCSKDRDVWFHQWATLSWKWLSLSLSPVMAPGLNSGFTDWYTESSADSFLQRFLRMGNRCALSADSCQCMAKTTTIL